MTRYWTLAAAIASLALAAVLLSRNSATPSGQPALAPLSGATLAEIKEEFNRTSSGVRVLLLSAPSCPFCLKGTTEIERILESRRDRAISVFAVWQPILPTDWSKPNSTVLHRLRDGRVRQFWDPDRTVAAELKRATEHHQIYASCCVDNGVLWDFMAVFAPGALWEDMLPAPILFEGTIEDAAPRFASLLAKPSSN
jgi:hypothetical protein